MPRQAATLTSPGIVRSRKMILWALSAIFMAVSILQAEKQETETFTHELGENGLITHWLVLGYLPGIQGPEADRLESIGGEASISPHGGDTVTIKGAGENATDLNLTWMMAEVIKPEMPYWAIQSRGLYLFTDEKGIPIPNAQAYAYCELLSEVGQNLVLKMSDGEPITIWLNGEHVEIKDRGKQLWADRTKVNLALKSGANRFLVRIDNTGSSEFLSMQLVDENGKPIENVRVQLEMIKDCPELSQVYQKTQSHWNQETQDWNVMIAGIPPLAKSEDEQLFGANLSRTMALLKTGGRTKRPVRIFFYGQSITTSYWTFFLVRRLRELYPDTEIIAENRARSGWGLDKLNRTIKHDILRERPDLIILHAYTPYAQTWERIIQQIRQETTADIMIRTGHIAGRDMKPYHEKGMPQIWEDGEWKAREEPYDETKENPIPEDDDISLGIRRLARQYGCELVECRKEWLAYMREHGLMGNRDLLSDGLHINWNGCILMAQMYERHFRECPISRAWFTTVRRYYAMRPIADMRKDEIQLIGDGWKLDNANGATSTVKDDRLTLKFYGNRVELVMPPCTGKAKVLIDGKTPSELNILQGTFPAPKGLVPAYLMTYYPGENAIEEDWTLRVTHLSGDYRNYRFTLTGSKTGFDGEGDNSKPFVSNSGRITILNNDFNPNVNVKNLIDRKKKELEPVEEDLLLTWSLRQPFPDEVRGQSNPRSYERYVTVMDGLPEGEHELTLIPEYSEESEETKRFTIEAVEIHCPPLWRE